ncbi:Mu-like prophage FluMu tail sheath protein [Leminorella grimontii]|uniref:Mu-like prophage FluMu tail sheath protein n=1 Tax=Leminorella grimontii TaxID=82981 RepID=A0AAV5N984_9GAMM|nr:phage tail sheath subtilisin-like domain-containing protein [Leminorella grimontii]KFC92449.1 bacteriophage tail sheath protein [Leminorella grimontii ATCC 33999 = DSM 5078]GKX57614.1 Mu-like prophage FluMu tail sheath protein [Leminorella grimontii]VFS55832.1 Mu-like prophage tail sheath protein gpL [Leminorella grimontii]
MSIAYETIDNTVRVPLAYIEFDNSGAVKGTPALQYRTLMLGLRLSSGRVSAGEPMRITRSDAATDAFGQGSQLATMARAFINANPTADLWCLAVDDDEDGTRATGTIVLTGPCTTAGQITLMIAGVKAYVNAKVGDTAAALAQKIATVVNDDASLPVTAGVVDAKVTFTAKWSGLTGNDIDLRINYYTGEMLPEGVGCTITPMAGGVGNPDLGATIAAFGETWWQFVVNPFTDTANLDLLSAEFVSRWGGMRQIDSTCFMAYRGTYAQTSAFGTARNDYLFCTMGTNRAPEPAYIWASVLAAVSVKSLAIDPARPLQTLTLTGLKPPSVSDRWTWQERNLHLYDGVSVYSVDAGGYVQIDRCITMYRVNKYGSPDPSYLDVETIATLSYIRYAIRTRITQKFPRHKLADDGTRFGPGQPMVTPRIITDELLALFTELEEKGLVENFEAFKSTLIVERNADDRNRLDVRSNEDLVNQFRVYAHAIQFVL